MLEQVNERRRFRRFPFEAAVNIYSPSRKWQGELVDISLKGVLITKPSDWDGKIDQRYRVELMLAGSVYISMAVTVAHVDETTIGCQCDKIDLDSFTHLKRLIELNLGDPNLLNRELSALG